MGMFFQLILIDFTFNSVISFIFLQTKAYTRTSGYGKTPFPSVDTFFNGILRETGRDCWIGKWEFESGSQTMRLFVDGDSNCCEGTVEGQQDNTCKTLIVAFFKSKTYFVKCPGKECGSKRPELKPLPDLESLPIVTSTVPPHDWWFFRMNGSACLLFIFEYSRHFSVHSH